MRYCIVFLVFLSMLWKNSTALVNEIFHFSSYNSNTRISTISSYHATSSINLALNWSCLDESFQCSPWSYCDNLSGTCKCFRNSGDIFVCDSQGNRHFILNCYCLTYDARINTTELGFCVYNCDYAGKSKYDVSLPYCQLPSNINDLNNAMCTWYNRTGTLCGQCMNNTYLRAYSYDMSCTRCKSGSLNFFKYITIAYVPLTLLYVAVLLLDVNIPSSHFQGYVFLSQIMSSPIILRHFILFYQRGHTNEIIFKLLQTFGTISGICNLDFFRLLNTDICFQISSLAIISLDFFVAIYPLLLMVITYMVTVAHDSNFTPVVVVLKPFKAIFRFYKSNWNVRTSTIDAFATFMYLSNEKFLIVCFDLLVPVQVCDTSNNDTCKLALFYDATVPYFGNAHLPYAIPALLVLTVFVALPLLILMLYPFRFCQKCLNRIPQRWQIILHIFVDSFQGCYKNGIEPGTRDCRWFSAVSFLVHFIIFAVYAIIIVTPFTTVFAMIITLTALLVIIVDPFKPQFQHYSKSLIIFILCMASLIMSEQATNFTNSSVVFYTGCVVVIIQLVFCSLLIFTWIMRHRKFCLRFT